VQRSLALNFTWQSVIPLDLRLGKVNCIVSSLFNRSDYVQDDGARRRLPLLGPYFDDCSMSVL
jgi:hypothetical protein